MMNEIIINFHMQSSPKIQKISHNFASKDRPHNYDHGYTECQNDKSDVDTIDCSASGW